LVPGREAATKLGSAKSCRIKNQALSRPSQGRESLVARHLSGAPTEQNQDRRNGLRSGAASGIGTQAGVEGRKGDGGDNVKSGLLGVWDSRGKVILTQASGAGAVCKKLGAPLGLSQSRTGTDRSTACCKASRPRCTEPQAERPRVAPWHLKQLLRGLSLSPSE